MNGTFKIKFKHVAIAGYLYMLLPIVVFFITWLHLYIGILASLILLLGFVSLLKSDYVGNKSDIELPIRALILVALVFLIWVWLSGLGGFFNQTWDYHYRNAVFRDLIDLKWPIIYSVTGNALVYNVTHWLIPALFGKIFGWSGGNIALAVWTYVGVLISFLLVVSICKSFTLNHLLLTCIIFVLWSGLDGVGQIIMDIGGQGTYGLASADEWTNAVNAHFNFGYQYSSNDTLLSWVFNQTIAPWIAVPLVLENRKISSFAFIALCVLPSAPLPFIGLAMILMILAVPIVLSYLREKQYLKLMKEIFSIPNIAAVLSIFLVFQLFFQSNISGGSIGLYIPLRSYNVPRIGILLLFYFLEFGIYLLLIRKQYRKDILLYAIGISLVVIPFFQVGHSSDFCMRASIPALFLLMILVIQYAHKLRQICRQNFPSAVVFIIVLTLGLSNPILGIAGRIGEYNNSIVYTATADDIKTFRDKKIGDQSVVGPDEIDKNYENFLVPDYESAFFYKYLAK